MLVTICGSMFAEKSTELQRRGKRLARAGKKVTYFKPDFDNRYSEDEIVTHDGKSVPAININHPIQLYKYIDHTDVFLIDEIQFFEEEIQAIVKVLLNKHGKTVIVAGLDIDFKGVPFMNTAYFMATADEVVKLHAVCTTCGNDAWVSAKKEDGKGRVELGADDLYYPLCRKCFVEEARNRASTT